MDEFLEITAQIKREGDKFRVTCPQIGLTLTSSDEVEAVELMKRWAYALVDPLIVKDLSST